MQTRCNTCVLVAKLDISKSSAAKQVLPSIGFVVMASALKPAAKHRLLWGSSDSRAPVPHPHTGR